MSGFAILGLLVTSFVSALALAGTGIAYSDAKHRPHTVLFSEGAANLAMLVMIVVTISVSFAAGYIARGEL